MKINIKKLFLIFAVALSLNLGVMSCFAAEPLYINLGSDYIVTTAKTVKANEVSNPQILTLSPFFTIFNEKNVLLLHPQKVGKTNITFFLEDGSESFDIVIKSKGTSKNIESFKRGDFEFSLLDSPPVVAAPVDNTGDDFEDSINEDLQLDAPPVDNGAN